MKNGCHWGRVHKTTGMIGCSSSEILCEPQRREEINHSELTHCFHMHSRLSVTDMNVSRRNTRCQKYFWLTYTQPAITQRSVRKKEPHQLLIFIREQLERRKKWLLNCMVSYSKTSWCFLQCLLYCKHNFLKLGTEKVMAIEKNLSILFKGLP